MKQVFLVNLNTVFIVGMSTEEIYLKILFVLLSKKKKKTDKTREEETAEPVITSSIIGQTVISPIKSLGLSWVDFIGIGCHHCSINHIHNMRSSFRDSEWRQKCWSYAYWTMHHLDIWIKVSECSSGSACTRIPHHQQPILLHNTNTPQVSTLQPTQ